MTITISLNLSTRLDSLYKPIPVVLMKAETNYEK